MPRSERHSTGGVVSPVNGGSRTGVSSFVVEEDFCRSVIQGRPRIWYRNPGL